MKKFFLFTFIGAFAAGFISSCSSGDDSNDVWDEYKEYREANDAFMVEQEALTDDNGNKVFTKVVPAWNENAYVLMRWFNDTTLNRGNLTPIYTSTVDVKFYGRNYENEPFDSSYLSLQPADSVIRCQINSVIPGWAIAMEKMHVGDTVEVIIPYAQAYGSTSRKGILPFSALKFNIKLVNVAGQNIRP